MKRNLLFVQKSDYNLNNSFLKALIAIVFLFLLSIEVCGQSKEVSSGRDTVFVLFNSRVNKVLESGISVYHKPELSYPMDVSRSFIINKFQRITSSKKPDWSKSVIDLGFNPQIHNYSLIPKRQFLKLNHIDQNWINQTDYEDILAYLKGKTIYLVDDAYLYNGNLFLLEVVLYDGIEEEK